MDGFLHGSVEGFISSQVILVVTIEDGIIAHDVVYMKKKKKKKRNQLANAHSTAKLLHIFLLFSVTNSPPSKKLVSPGKSRLLLSLSFRSSSTIQALDSAITMCFLPIGGAFLNVTWELKSQLLPLKL